jgi:hypothetical protein
MSRFQRRRAAVVALTAALLAAPGVAFAASPGVDPQSVDLTLSPGDSKAITKTVTTPKVLPKPDIYFLADTTGSMGGSIANVSANSNSIMSAVNAATTDAQFGAGDYKDFPYDSPVFRNDQSITGAVADVTTAINSWSAGGGSDGPEGNLYALHKAITSAGFRSGSSKIIVWFGDAPGHDPVCSAISGEPTDVTEASVTSELKAAGIKVIAISVTSGFPKGLDDDPAAFSSDYGVCGASGGTEGQATRITTATGGAFFSDVAPDEVKNKILEGVTALPATVTAQTTCDPGLSLAFAPTLPQTVNSGEALTLSETVKVASDAASGIKACTTKFLINGTEAGDAFTQTVKVNVAPLNKAPDCSKAKASVTQLWPPDHALKTITVSVPDPDGDKVTTTITGVTQDEAINGLGDGDTGPDAAWVTGHSDQVKLRAERSGTGDGRVYRISVKASDGTAECAGGKVLVTVPHDQAKPAVDTTAVVVNSFGS